MKGQTLLSQYLLAKPTLRMMIEWPIMIIIGILGEIFSWVRIPFSPYSNLAGAAVFVGGWIFHAYCHRTHKQAHEQSQHVEGLVTTGVFSKMRHSPVSRLDPEDAVMFVNGIYSLALLLRYWKAPRASA